MHAHAQIEYGSCESLIGFNPGDKEDRELIHEMLDEYLDVLKDEMEACIKRGDNETQIHGVGFVVDNFMHE